MKAFKVLVAAAALSVSAIASAASYELEKPHTQLLFTVNHLGFSHSTGRFLEFDGQFDFELGNWAEAKAEVTIKTASVEMNHEKWNAHLRNADFFDVEKFPEMTFVSTKVEPIDDNNAVMTGDLTLLGVTKPVSLNVRLNKLGKHPFKGTEHIGFSASGTLKRSDFGMTYGIPAVGDEVKLTIEVEGLGGLAFEPGAAK